MNLYFFISLSDATGYTIFSTYVILYFWPISNLVCKCFVEMEIDFDRSVIHTIPWQFIFLLLYFFIFCKFVNVMCEIFNQKNNSLMFTVTTLLATHR